MSDPDGHAQGARMQAQANLEIKARCPDLAAARETASRLATSRVGLDHQVDVYFCTRRGRLKLRQSSLSGAQLVPYLRPDASGPRRADYEVVPVESPDSLRALLAAILGVHRVVVKQREIFLYENVRIHLDQVEGLGDFLELEAVYDGSPGSEPEQRRKLGFLMRELAIGEADLVPTSYEALSDPAGA